MVAVGNPPNEQVGHKTLKSLPERIDRRGLLAGGLHRKSFIPTEFSLRGVECTP